MFVDSSQRLKLDMPGYDSTRLPLYAQVEDALSARIASGALPVGTQLPSEEELIREFGVSRTTIRVTIQNLVRQGLVEIRRGRGKGACRQRGEPAEYAPPLFRPPPRGSPRP
jgi:DNA-binding GntR family transcriptional regulator